MVVKAEYRDDLDGAINVCNSALSLASADATVQFLLRECLGRQLCFVQRHEEAFTWLKQAIEQPTTAYAWTRVYALTYASVSRGVTDPSDAVRLMSKAVKLMRALPQSDRSTASERLEFAKVLCELGLAQWAVSDIHGAFVTLDEIGGWLFRFRSKTDDLKEVVVLYCHLLGYVRSIATTGKPPESLASDEKYSEPRRGVFMTTNPARRSFHSELRENLRYMALADSANAVGEHSRAAALAREGIEVAKTRGPSWIVGHLASYIIADELLQGRFGSARDLMLEAAKYLAAAKVRHQQGEFDVGTVFEPDEVLRNDNMSTLHGWQRHLPPLLIVGMAFRVGIAAVSEPDSVHLMCLSAIDTCNYFSSEPANVEVWKAAAMVFEMMNAEGSTSSELVDFAKRYHEDEYKPVKAVAYLFATIKQKGEPDQAVHAQLVVFPFIDEYLRISPGIYQLGLEFLTQYWMHHLDRSALLFRSPRLVRQAISESQHVPGWKRGQALLAAVADAFDRPLHLGAKKWLGRDRTPGD
jgi:TPR repeat protein